MLHKACTPYSTHKDDSSPGHQVRAHSLPQARYEHVRTCTMLNSSFDTKQRSSTTTHHCTHAHTATQPVGAAHFLNTVKPSSWAAASHKVGKGGDSEQQHNGVSSSICKGRSHTCHSLSQPNSARQRGLPFHTQSAFSFNTSKLLTYSPAYPPFQPTTSHPHASYTHPITSQMTAGDIPASPTTRHQITIRCRHRSHFIRPSSTLLIVSMPHHPYPHHHNQP